MTGRDERGQAVARLWNEHVRAPFPARLRGVEVAGVDMVLLDADIAGCASAWQLNEGTLDDQRQRVVRSCLGDLDHVLPSLKDVGELAYYRRLQELARLVAGRDGRPLTRGGGDSGTRK